MEHMQGKRKRSVRKRARKETYDLFNAQAAYAESMFQFALGDQKGGLSALRRSHEYKHDYAPTILSLGSVEYQLGRPAQGRKLFLSLLSLPDNTPDLCIIIDEAGSYLIQEREYKDGLELYRAAVARFPQVAVLHEGLGCCAGHEGFHDEAIAASRRALDLEPDNPEFVNNLGWSLYEAGHLQEAETVLARAVSMDPSDELARENLRLCRAEMAKSRKKKRDA
jgi:tetratricopeptide (TPR) repeat protein